jgi:hypothetical protein
MKIVQTYWSVPAARNAAQNVNGRNNGGWPSEKFHAFSWALSSLKFSEFYSDRTLYTDADGENWLINKLGLPYTNVITSLDHLNHFNPLLWAIPKIYVYGQQTTPFIHADGDVFIWRKFDEEFEKNDLIVQNFELDFPYYRDSIDQIIKHFKHIPAEIKHMLYRNETVQSVNAGVMGGQNYAFFQKFAAFVFEFIQRNIETVPMLDVGTSNTFFEQLLFYILAKREGLRIRPLMDDVDETFSKVLGFSSVPVLNTYIHTVGISKSKDFIFLELQARLKHEFPKVYNHIRQLYPERQNLYISSPNQAGQQTDNKSAFRITRERLGHFQNDTDCIEDQKLVELCEYLTDKEELSTAERLLNDAFQIEKSALEVSGNHHTPDRQLETLKNSIEKRVGLINSLTENSFLKIPFTLNTKCCQIIFLYYDLGEKFSIDDWPAINEKIDPYVRQDPKIYLVTYFHKKLEYTLLSGWDILLFYFENASISGKQLAEFIASGQTPFEYAENEIDNDIHNFIAQNFLCSPLLEPVFNN